MPGHNQGTCAAHNYIHTIFRASIATYVSTIYIQFVDSYSRAIQRASNGKSSLHRIYKDEYSNDFAYAVIRLIKITARNEKALTVRGTACKFLHGPKQILPGPGPGWPGCGYATASSSSRQRACGRQRAIRWHRLLNDTDIRITNTNFPAY